MLIDDQGHASGTVYGFSLPTLPGRRLTLGKLGLAADKIPFVAHHEIRYPMLPVASLNRHVIPSPTALEDGLDSVLYIGFLTKLFCHHQPPLLQQFLGTPSGCRPLETALRAPCPLTPRSAIRRPAPTGPASPASPT